MLLPGKGMNTVSNEKCFYAARILSLIQTFPERELAGDARNYSLFPSPLMWYPSKLPLVEQLPLCSWHISAFQQGGGMEHICPGQWSHAQLFVPRGWQSCRHLGNFVSGNSFQGNAGFFFGLQHPVHRCSMHLHCKRMSLLRCHTPDKNNIRITSIKLPINRCDGNTTCTYKYLCFNIMSHCLLIPFRITY